MWRGTKVKQLGTNVIALFILTGVLLDIAGFSVLTLCENEICISSVIERGTIISVLFILCCCRT